MSLSLGHLTFDCENAAELAGFWSALLELPVDPDPSKSYASVGIGAGATPALMFIEVPDKTPGKNVIHLDLHSDRWREHVERAIGLGAKHLADFDEFGARWATLADPEGNLFDIGTAG